jgi:hypothetical protein
MMNASKLLQMLAQIDTRILDAERRVRIQYRVISRDTTVGEVLNTALKVLRNLEETLDALRGARGYLLEALKRESNAGRKKTRCNKAMPTPYRKQIYDRRTAIKTSARAHGRLWRVFFDGGDRPAHLNRMFDTCCPRSGEKRTHNTKREIK